MQKCIVIPFDHARTTVLFFFLNATVKLSYQIKGSFLGQATFPRVFIDQMLWIFKLLHRTNDNENVSPAGLYQLFHLCAGTANSKPH